VEGERPDATVLELLDVVDGLASFPFGRFWRTAAGWLLDRFRNDASRARPVARNCPRRSALDSLAAATFLTVLATQQRSRHFARLSRRTSGTTFGSRWSLGTDARFRDP
jgi:hypothetical protein